MSPRRHTVFSKLIDKKNTKRTHSGDSVGSLLGTYENQLDDNMSFPESPETFSGTRSRPTSNTSRVTIAPKQSKGSTGIFSTAATHRGSSEKDKRRKSSLKSERRSSLKKDKRFEKRLSSIENTLSRIESQRAVNSFLEGDYQIYLPDWQESEPRVGPGGEGPSNHGMSFTGIPMVRNQGLSNIESRVLPISNQGSNNIKSPSPLLSHTGSQMVPFNRSPGFENDLRPPTKAGLSDAELEQRMRRILSTFEPSHNCATCSAYGGDILGGNCKPLGENLGTNCPPCDGENPLLTHTQVGGMQEKLASFTKMVTSGNDEQRTTCGIFGKNFCKYLIILVMLLYLSYWMLFVCPYTTSKAIHEEDSKSFESGVIDEKKKDYCSCDVSSLSDSKRKPKTKQSMRCTCKTLYVKKRK